MMAEQKCGKSHDGSHNSGLDMAQAKSIALILIICCLSVVLSQRKEVDYLEPPLSGPRHEVLESGQGRSLGLALDSESLESARNMFPLVYTAPSRIYILVFNTTGVKRTKRVDNGWPGVDAWMRIEGLTKSSMDSFSNYDQPGPFNVDTVNGYRIDTRGGASMYAILSLAQALPPSSSLALVTSRPPSDTDLASQAQTSLIDKKIQLSVYWTGKSKRGQSWLEDIATNTGGNLHDRTNDVNSLKQVTLLVRDNMKGDTRNKIEIDSSLKDLIVTIKGQVKSATLLPAGGYVVNALDGNGEQVSKKTISLSGQGSGDWYLDVKGEDTPYSLTVDATSHLALWARATNHSIEAKKKTVELWLDGKGVRRIDEVELVDGEGRQLAALGHRETRSQDNSVSSTVELDTYATRQPAFLRLTATNNNGEQFTRLTRIPDTMLLPTSIEVGLGSTLVGMPGQRAIIYFNVANNRWQPMYYDFTASDTNNWLRYVQPRRTMINGMSVEQVRVEIQAPYSTETQAQPADIVTLRALLSTGESVTQRAYFSIGQTSYDSTSPSIWYSYNGDCSNTLGPENCYIASWGANVTIQDTGSGLLKITSRPVALRLEKEFVAGTTDEINAKFTASCCQTKVEVTATDTIGNKYTKIIDIERKWLTTGEISAIVLGSILLLLIIIAIIVLSWWCCCRRNRSSLAIYPDH